MKNIYKLSGGYYTRAKNLLLVMKLTILAFFLTTMGLSASTYSQKTKLSLNLENVSIKEVLQSIEFKSEFVFIYENQTLKLDKKVSVFADELTVDKILSDILKETNIKYEIIDKQIILTKKDIIKEMPVISPKIEGGPQPQEKVTGRVTDEKGQSLPGVTVIVKGTTLGTITDVEGGYSLANIPKNSTLQFSFVGMKTQEIKIGEKQVINAALELEELGLEEVVVVGYGTQKKVNLTGAVDVVTVKDLENRPSSNVSLLLQGTTPSLNIALNNMGGEPGAKQNWQIRGIGSISGNDDPLILVDGVEMDVNLIDPESIENVSVLKDASASAIYGSRAALG